MFSALQDKVLQFIYILSIRLVSYFLLQLVFSTATEGGYLCCLCVGRASFNAVKKSVEFLLKEKKSREKMVLLCLQFCKS